MAVGSDIATSSLPRIPPMTSLASPFATHERRVMVYRSILLPFSCAVSAVLAFACANETAAPAAPAPNVEIAGNDPADRGPSPSGANAPAVVPTAAVDASVLARFKRLRSPDADSRLAQLGKTLFFEVRLSKSQKLSCNSCHSLAAHGVDNQPFSMGHEMQRGGRNAPTVYNAAGHVAQFWDGRAPDVEEQAKGPILNPVEMAMPDAAAVEAVLSEIPAYVRAFGDAFPGEANPVTFDNVGKAIGAFERRLFVPSRWDGFLDGEENALVAAEVKGLETFVKVGCASCHAGELIGGASFKKLGASRPWTRDDDRGRVAVTGDPNDERVFKVPSLRNIGQTGPYFHDGSVGTLEESVQLMAQVQLDTDLSLADVVSISTWLRSLTSSLPSDLVRPPLQVLAPGVDAGAPRSNRIASSE